MCRITTALSFSVAFLLLIAVGARAQNLNQEDASKATADTTDQAMPPMGAESSDMSGMAAAMKSMADMCRMMMDREMQSRPYVMIAGSVLGTLVFVALVLFVVLEIQWIRLLAVRIKTERHKQP
jgi:hypothetical protein